MLICDGDVGDGVTRLCGFLGLGNPVSGDARLERGRRRWRTPPTGFGNPASGDARLESLRGAPAMALPAYVGFWVLAIQQLR
jgi:hypothetical protein